MRKLTTIFAKFLEICKDFSSNLVNESGNVPRRGVIPKISDLEVIALSMTAEHFSIEHSFDLTPANVHDIHYLKDLRLE